MDDQTPILLEDNESIPSLTDMMKLMATKGGSDLFVSVGTPPRMKINGQQHLITTINVDKDDVAMMLTEVLKDSSDMGHLEKDKELNVAISVPRTGRFRLSGFQQRNNQAFVVRFIPPEIPHFDILGLPGILRELIMLKRGLLLMVGPTGSGKSTTLASMINLRNETKADHILTIEDPIEFLYRHKRSVVNQRELGTDAISYHDALRNAMRQAPDLIMIGEIRDQETMAMAMQYAQSGHLCVATMHANNSYHALNRILGFYPPDQRKTLYSDLASSLKSIISQRLVPALNGARAAAVEVMIVTRSISEMIESGKFEQIPELIEKTAADGAQTFENVLLEMVKKNIISSESALAFSDSPTNMFWKLSNAGLKTKNREALIEAGVDRSKIAESEEHGEGQPAPAPTVKTDGGFSGIKLLSDE